MGRLTTEHLRRHTGVQWILAEASLEEWLQHAIKYSKVNTVSSLTSYNLIIGAFGWPATISGADYWRAANARYQNFQSRIRDHILLCRMTE